MREMKPGVVDRFHTYYKIDENGCWLWQMGVFAPGANGTNFPYGAFNVFYKEGKPKLWLAHRFMWTIHNNQDIPEGMVVMHKCDVPGCVRPDHLQLGTQSDNMKDAWSKGRMDANVGDNHSGKGIVTCEHCGKVGGLSGMRIWHGKRCKKRVI